MVYNIDGFSDMLLENEDFWNCYERFRIESNMPSVNPTTQMLFMIAQTTIIAHHTSKQQSDSHSEYEYEMEPPAELETIIEDIENSPKSELVITDKDDTPIEDPIRLGQTL